MRHFAFFLALVLVAPDLYAQNTRLAFWDQQRKGANGDGGVAEGGGTSPEAWFEAAGNAGIEYVRLFPVEWASEGRDFLIGNADKYTDIQERDYEKLREVLDIAVEHNVKIVLSMFSLPGARNRQENDYEFDYRMWTDESYQQQALDFWNDLAGRLKNHPAIVGYNPINEPHPARKDGFQSGGDLNGFEEWLLENEGSTSDLNRFNARVVEAIRLEDPQTPIILDSWFHASPEGFKFLKPIEEDGVLYAFHTYGVWRYATFRINKGRFAYPGKMPGPSEGKTRYWGIDELREQIAPVVEWAGRYNIPASRIIVEEFGCDRRVEGAEKLLSDMIEVFNEQDWHWAFYSFRSSTWDGLDYELGSRKLGGAYWDQRDQGINHEALISRGDNPLWDIFKKELSRR